MARLLGLLSVGLLVCQSAATAQDAEQADGLDVTKLVGKWSYVKGMRAGEESGADRMVGTVTISKDEFRIPAGPDMEFVMGYEIDGDEDPAAIDIVIKDGPVADAKALGIIKLDDGKITLCYDPNGETRPEKFESTEDNGFFMFVLKQQDD